jgi:hypothetical protein
MFTLPRFKVSLLTLAFSAVIVSCAVQLAPAYDVKIYDGIIALNNDAQVFFAAAENGLKKSTFDKTEPTYNELIGTLNSLIIQLDARPVPESKMLDKINEKLKKEGKAPFNFSENLPTRNALQIILDRMVNLKTNHAKRDVKAIEISTAKQAFNIAIDQAITFESHLER